MQKHIKTALVLLCFTIPLLFLGIRKSIYQTYTMSKGNYFFQNTRERADIAKIKITFPNEETVTVIQKDGLWRIAEADNYYAALPQVNNLVNVIRHTVIFRADTMQPQDAEKYFVDAVKIESFDEKEKIVDSAVIAPHKEKNKYQYAILNGDNYLYQLSGKIAFSPYIAEWVKMPLLQLEDRQIKNIKSNDFEVYREYASDALKSVTTKEPTPHIAKLTNDLWFLVADEIKEKNHFDLTSAQLVREYDIHLFSGIIYQLKIYSDNKDYWLNITLNKEFLVNNDAAVFIKENALLYENWFFKLSRDIGESIARFIL